LGKIVYGKTNAKPINVRWSGNNFYQMTVDPGNLNLVRIDHNFAMPTLDQINFASIINDSLLSSLLSDFEYQNQPAQAAVTFDGQLLFRIESPPSVTFATYGSQITVQHTFPFSDFGAFIPLIAAQDQGLIVPSPDGTDYLISWTGHKIYDFPKFSESNNKENDTRKNLKKAYVDGYNSWFCFDARQNRLMRLRGWWL
jgi:hypothetical protein